VSKYSTQSEFIDENMTTVNKGQTMCINWPGNKLTMKKNEEQSVNNHQAMVKKV